MVSWVLVVVVMFWSCSFISMLVLLEGGVLLFFGPLVVWCGFGAVWWFLTVSVVVISLVMSVYVWCVYVQGLQMVWCSSL
nr:NADH dehydrogenase subunit 4L [Pseudoacanthocephalus sp.]